MSTGCRSTAIACYNKQEVLSSKEKGVLTHNQDHCHHATHCREARRACSTYLKMGAHASPKNGQTVKGSCSRLSPRLLSTKPQHFYPFAEKLPSCDRQILVTNSTGLLCQTTYHKSQHCQGMTPPAIFPPKGWKVGSGVPTVSVHKTKAKEGQTKLAVLK